MAESEKSNNEMRETVKESVKEIIEIIDDKIIGDIMDIPIIDKIEEALVNALVDSLWKFEAKGADSANSTDKIDRVINENTPFLPWSA
jgi:hypothetical protein